LRSGGRRSLRCCSCTLGSQRRLNSAMTSFMCAPGCVPGDTPEEASPGFVQKPSRRSEFPGSSTHCRADEARPGVQGQAILPTPRLSGLRALRKSPESDQEVTQADPKRSRGRFKTNGPWRFTGRGWRRRK
jgi:hypothetical protein